MASVDPAALAASEISDAAVAQELAVLASNAQALRGELHDGAVVTAQVLRSNGLTDVVQILGRRVAASLPANLTPGDLIVVTVSGFKDDRILLQNLGPVAANELPPVAEEGSLPEESISLPDDEPASPPIGSYAGAAPTAMAAPSAASSTQPGSLPSVGKSAPLPSAPIPAPLSAAGPAPSAPRAVFAEAAIRATVVARAPSSSVDGAETASRGPSPPSRAPAVPPPAARPSPVLTPRLTETLPEERIAAARPTLDAAALRSFIVRPQIVARTAPLPSSAPGTEMSATADPAAFRDPGRLASALGITRADETFAALRSALEEPAGLLPALRGLDEALAGLPGDDPRVATVRTIAAFVSALDPQSPALPSVLSAFVSHVVDGAEPKLAALFGALREGSGGVDVAAARLALGHDLKTNLLDLLARPPAGAGAAFARAIGTALGVLTGSQLDVNVRSGAGPITLTVPLAVGNPGTAAQIRLHRDGSRPNAPLDPDTFHLGFVLTTEHLGTVAIDVRTAQRAVTVGVLAESGPFAKAFGDALPQLSERLERLRYRVAKLDAGIAPRAPGAAGDTAVDEATSAADAGPLGTGTSSRVDVHI